MIKVYEITPKGKTFLRNKNLTGFARNELQPYLRECQEEGVEGRFCFDTSRESIDHSYGGHIKELEKMKCIERDTSSEEQIKDFLKSLPREDRRDAEYKEFLAEQLGL